MKQTMATAFDVEAIRKDFPILHRSIACKPLVYLDNAATSQKPQSVIDTLNHYYNEINANIHRGVHHLSVLATAAYEDARQKLAAFLNASDAAEIVFVRCTTEAVNLVAQSFVRPRVGEGRQVGGSPGKEIVGMPLGIVLYDAFLPGLPNKKGAIEGLSEVNLGYGGVQGRGVDHRPDVENRRNGVRSDDDARAFLLRNGYPHHAGQSAGAHSCRQHEDIAGYLSPQGLDGPDRARSSLSAAHG